MYLDKKKFNRIYTVVEGINDKEIDIKDLTRKLKNKFACGGTVKDGKIELQGDHKDKAKAVLLSEGFSEEQIDAS